MSGFVTESLGVGGVTVVIVFPLVPDSVDSHTRFPICICFPVGSGLVAFAAATGVMPESMLVRFKGKMQDSLIIGTSAPTLNMNIKH